MQPNISVEFSAKAAGKEFKEESVTFHDHEELFDFIGPGGGCEKIPDEVDEIQLVFLQPSHPNTDNPLRGGAASRFPACRPVADATIRPLSQNRAITRRQACLATMNPIAWFAIVTLLARGHGKLIHSTPTVPWWRVYWPSASPVMKTVPSATAW